MIHDNQSVRILNLVMSVIMQFQTEELEYMMWAYIHGDGNRTEARTRDQGSGMRTNYGEMRTRSINRNKWIARGSKAVKEDSEVHEGFGCCDRTTYSSL